MKMTILSALAAFTLAHGAHAIEVNGGTVELGYSSLIDITSLSSTKFTGGMEVGITRAFALQFDLGFFKSNSNGKTGRNTAMHAIYHVNDTTSLGAFASNDSVLGGNITYYGVEGGFEFTGFDAEVYLAAVDDSGVSGTLLGLNLHHRFDNNFGITGKIDHTSLGGGVDLTLFSVGVDYSLTPSSMLYAEIGSLEASVLGLSASQSFVGVGARINFGAARGVTFKRRGFLDLLPGL